VSAVPDDQDHETHQDHESHETHQDRIDADFAIDRDPAPRTEADERREARAARERIRHQHTWVDLQIRQAMERGEFDRLPGAGKPIEGLGAEHDPEWWLRGLIERERIALLPASLSLRKEDAELDDRLDALHVEADVRREVEEFNARVIRARYRPAEGPPLITMPRDVEATVEAWATRREARLAARRTAAAAEPPRRWWRRRRGAR
jgi:hypothetical protein